MLQTLAHLVKLDSIHSSNKVHVKMDIREKICNMTVGSKDCPFYKRTFSFKYVSVVFPHHMSFNLIVGCSCR